MKAVASPALYARSSPWWGWSTESLIATCGCDGAAWSHRAVLTGAGASLAHPEHHPWSLGAPATLKGSVVLPCPLVLLRRSLRTLTCVPQQQLPGRAHYCVETSVVLLLERHM